LGGAKSLIVSTLSLFVATFPLGTLFVPPIQSIQQQAAIDGMALRVYAESWEGTGDGGPLFSFP
jgi:hypothetical protein